MTSLMLIPVVFIILLLVWMLARLKVFIWDMIDHVGNLSHPASVVLPVISIIVAIMLACGLGILIVFSTMFAARLAAS